MIKNLPSNARNLSSTPTQGTKISHNPGQLSLSTPTTEPARPVACATQPERSPHTATKIPCATAKTQHSQKQRKETGGAARETAPNATSVLEAPG